MLIRFLILSACLQIFSAPLLYSDRTGGPDAGNYLIGTSAAVVYSFIPGSSILYYEMELGRRIDRMDSLWIGLDAFKYSAPMSLPWSGDSTRYPGQVLTIGPDFAYQRFIWGGFYAVPIINPCLVSYYNGANEFIQNGFLLLFCLRAGYQFDFELFSASFYIQIGAEINYWPVCLNEPQGFSEIDGRYPLYEMNPALNFGFKF